MNLRRLVYQAISRMFFRALIFSDESGFFEKLKMRTIEEKKDTELILHVWFSKSNVFEWTGDVERMLNAWKVLYCSSRCFRSQRRRRADERTFDASHDVFKTGCSKLWSCLPEITFFISSTGWYRRHFSFLSSSLKPRRSRTIFLSLSFSRESSMSECVKKM